MERNALVLSLVRATATMSEDVLFLQSSPHIDFTMVIGFSKMFVPTGKLNHHSQIRLVQLICKAWTVGHLPRCKRHCS